jgi:hypothetical protein
MSIQPILCQRFRATNLTFAIISKERTPPVLPPVLRWEPPDRASLWFGFFVRFGSVAAPCRPAGARAPCARGTGPRSWAARRPRRCRPSADSRPPGVPPHQGPPSNQPGFHATDSILRTVASSPGFRHRVPFMGLSAQRLRPVLQDGSRETDQTQPTAAHHFQPRSRGFSLWGFSRMAQAETARNPVNGVQDTRAAGDDPTRRQRRA